MLSAGRRARFSESPNPAKVIVGTSSSQRLFAARDRPCPAMRTPSSSTRMGLVNPKDVIADFSCSICRSGCVRAFRGSGVSSVIGPWVMAKGEFRDGNSISCASNIMHRHIKCQISDQMGRRTNCLQHRNTDVSAHTLDSLLMSTSLPVTEHQLPVNAPQTPCFAD